MTCFSHLDILVLNGGSSSIKFAVYRPVIDALERRLVGTIDRIGRADSRLLVSGASGEPIAKQGVAAANDAQAASALLEWLEHDGGGFASIGAVGHRIVHGMRHVDPERITEPLLNELRRLEPSVPDHLPGELRLVELFHRRLPALPQVACFDTAFHRDLPRVAQLLPIPRRYDERGIRRYGFHGLSYAYVMEELARVAGEATAQGRVIVAHLGNGASMAAVLGGRPIDTSMAFTPTSGLPMGTRSGDLDAGLGAYLAREDGTSAQEFFEMTTHSSGLLGISGTSADMRDLLENEAADGRAAEAVALFCYQAKKWIGAFAAALGGVETLIFTGGMGENAGPVRSRICAGLGFLGIELDDRLNAGHGPVISSSASRVIVRVVATDEELMVARSVRRLLHPLFEPESSP